jgi:parallel beta-helix repeat protein
MIYNNTITGNSNPQENFNPTGILLGSCFMNTIANNTFETNHYGIYLSESAGNNPYYYRPNTIVNNLFISNDNSSITTDDYAIYIHKSSISNPITSNIIIATQDSYGIMIDSSSNQTITENTFEHAGISIQSTEKHHWNTHTIINNTANNKPIRYYCNATTITIPQNTSQIILANCNNITINSLNLNQKIDIPLQLAFTSNTKITNNMLATDDPNLKNKYAITLLQSPFNTITSNIISNCSIHGILIQQNSNYNEIQKNSITNNGGAGIQLHDSAYNTISNNSAISDNNKGISCISSNSNQILTNYAINNNLYKGIELQQTSNHLIYNNILMSNLIGIDLLDSSNTIISRNSIDNEGDWTGIQLTSSSNNDIKNNSVTQNQVGILLQTHSDNNIITANNITFNNYRGLEIKEPCSIGNIIYYNNFINTPLGQNANDSCSNTYDFSQIGNHWSDYSGSGSYTILPLPTTMDNFPIISPISLECGSLRVPISGGLIGYPQPGWTTGGNSEWFIQSSYVLEGEVALQSGPIDHNQHSLVSTIVDGPGTLSFFWSVHSEPFGDTLSVFIDNQKIEQISGEVFWMPIMLDIPHGYHEITWVYSKNEHDSFGMDCGWIDAITWEGIMTIPSTPTPYDGEQQIEKNPQLSFIAGDPDPGDMVTYELYLSTNPNPELLTTLGPYPWDQTYITYSPGELIYGLTYYWKIVSWDNHGNTVESPLWKFTVKEKFSHAGLWHFNEGMGQTAYDETPYQNHGVIHGSTWVEGYLGSGLYFDGNDDVTISHCPSLDIQGPFCVSAWIQALGNDNYNCIVDKYYHAGAYGYGFSVYLNAGKLRFTIYSGQHGIKDLIGTTDLRNNGWQHINAEWDGTTMSVSVNGIQEKAVEWAHPPASTTANLGIGKRLSGWGGFLYFKGYIDEVHITVNDAPYIASNPNPSHGQNEVSPSTILSWTGGDPNYEDKVYYDIYLEGEDQTPDESVAFNLEDTSFDVTDILLNNTVYYWYVISKDNHGLRSTSPVWMFETIQGYSNTPPNVPSSPLPENEAVNQPTSINLSWISQDPDGDLVIFDIYLEANDPTPDEMMAQGHTLSFLNVENLEQETTYYWQVVAWDTYGESTYGPVWSFTTEQNPFMTMTRVLSQGWNYVSFNVIPEDASMSSIMQPLIDQEVYLIVHDGQTGIFWPAYSIDTIGQMDITKGYRIYVNQQATLEVTGLRISLPQTIYLWEGWNIIGCPFDQPRDALEFLQPIIDEQALLYVKSQDEKAIYYEDSTWVNEIGNFTPGYAYYIKVSNDVSLTIPAL